MDTRLASRISSTDRLSGGVIVTFDDDVSALFSASFLRASLTMAEEVIGLPDLEDHEQVDE